MKWYSIRLLFESVISDNVENVIEGLMEQSFRIILANDDNHALKKATEVGRKQEHEYENEFGETCELANLFPFWKFKIYVKIKLQIIRRCFLFFLEKEKRVSWGQESGLHRPNIASAMPNRIKHFGTASRPRNASLNLVVSGNHSRGYARLYLNGPSEASLRTYAALGCR